MTITSLNLMYDANNYSKTHYVNVVIEKPHFDCVYDYDYYFDVNKIQFSNNIIIQIV